MLIATAVVTAACAWNDRGADPLRLPPASVVDSYLDIPEPVRRRLRSRLEAITPDDVATIRPERIESQAWSYSGLRDMHFGAGRVCRRVDMSGWAPSDPGEVGLVYCEDEHCLIVPTVCRNVSRVTRDGPRREAPGQVAGGELSWSEVVVAPPPAQSLLGPPAEPPGPTTPPGPADAPVATSWASAGHPVAFGSWPGGPGAVSLPPLPAAAPRLEAHVEPVPEPETLAMIAVGLAVVAWRRYTASR